MSLPPPWFRRPAPLPAGTSVAVVGAGIAGTAVAAALATVGLRPLLVERHAAPGAEASGNPCGLLKPRLTADGGLHGRFYGQAYLHAVATVDRLAAGVPEVWAGRGLLAVARDADERATMNRLHRTLPKGEAVPVDSAEAAALAGVRAPHGGLWYPRGGAIRPAAVCAALAGDIPRRRAGVLAVAAGAGGWRLSLDDGSDLDAEAVVLCGGADLPALAPAAELPLFANRGQVTLVAARPGPPTVAVTYGGYVTPAVAVDGVAARVIGATYRRLGPAGTAALGEADWRRPDPADDAANRALLAAHLPEVADAWETAPVLGARVAARATVADHMPLMGPLFAAEALREAYADLHHGRRAETYPPAPWTPGLFMLGGLGSRGFQTAPLLAEALAALMTGAPPPLAEDLLAAVHPARFVLRALRKSPAAGRRRAADP